MLVSGVMLSNCCGDDVDVDKGNKMKRIPDYFLHKMKWEQPHKFMQVEDNYFFSGWSVNCQFPKLGWENF